MEGNSGGGGGGRVPSHVEADRARTKTHSPDDMTPGAAKVQRGKVSGCTHPSGTPKDGDVGSDESFIHRVLRANHLPRNLTRGE